MQDILYKLNIHILVDTILLIAEQSLYVYMYI